MKLSNILGSVVLGSVVLGSLATNASALENRIGIRSECGSSYQNITGTTKNFSNGVTDTVFKDNVSLPDNGGTKVVTGTEKRNFSSETMLNVVGGSKANYTQVEAFVNVN